MTRCFFLLSFSLVCMISGFPVLAQSTTDSLPVLRKEQPVIDSLKALLNTTQKAPDQFKVLGQIIWEYASTREQLSLAHQYVDSMQRLAEELHDERGLAYAQFYYGVIARHQGNFSQALEHLQQYVAYHAANGDSTRVASGLFQIGCVHTEMENYHEGLLAFQRTVEIHEKDGFWYGVGFTLNGIGQIYKTSKKYKNAIDTYQKALSIFDTLDAPADQSDVLGNLANVYADTHQFEEARNYYLQALSIDKALGSEWAIAYDLENIGTMHNGMQQYDSALVYQLQALAIRERLPQQHEIAMSYKQVGNTYLFLKDYSLAKQYLVKGIALAREIEAKPLMRDLYDVLAQLYAQEKDFPKAYAYHQQYTAIHDSVLNEESTRQLNELQTKYETAEKDKQITLLAKEKEIQTKETQRQTAQKRASLTGLILVSLLAVLLAYIFRQRLKSQQLLAAKQEEVKEANFRQQCSDLEMKALRAQINPHFLFNCMNSINRMILQGDTENASLYLTKFSKLVRLILENTEATRVSLENELAMLETYIQLEALRFHGKINYKILVDESIEVESTYLPAMVLQPFVENAIWHGLMHKEEAGTITIAVKEEEDRLLCTIEDNGVGRAKAQLLQETSILKSKSMGIKITEERLRLLSKERLEQLIRFTDLKDSLDQVLGTRVDIMVPMA